MRRFMLLLTVLILVISVACSGGDDDGSDGGGGGGDNGGSSSGDGGSSSNNDGGGGGSNDGGGGGSNDGGGGSDSNFCSPSNADAIFGAVDISASTDFEVQFTELRSVLNSWKNDAPNDIEDDVDLVVNTMTRFIDLLEENDFNFLAIGGAGIQNDPRFLALEDPAFEAATDRVSEYCGFEDDGGSFFGGTDGGGSTGSGGSTGGGFSVDLPEDFPADLVPPPPPPRLHRQLRELRTRRPLSLRNRAARPPRS